MTWKKVCSFKYYDIEEMHSIQIPHKNKSLSLFHINACSLNKNFDDLQQDFCGFYGFSFIDNSNITEDFLHNDELHLNKVGSFLLGQNFVKYFNECL